MTTAEILHRLVDAVVLPTGEDREQLHAAIDTAYPEQTPAAEEPAVADLTKSDPAPAATTAYGPGALPTIQGGPYAAPLTPDATAALLGQQRIG
ncbi:hypothetical protein [Kitasatospora sp. NPDC057198]|uniref:hypothetical protein n=1 Tax=Kitasatospora sp. NPDC057198 TaxID=3346046 RepID=UPI00362E1AE7